MIKEENNLNFCCKGCQGVYHILKDDGLDSFYDKLGNKTISPPLEISNDDLSKFDSENFLDNYTTITKEGFTQIDLIIEGIHCAACVWLNEKILYETKGIIEANINFTSNKARIIWDSNKLKLSEIILKIRSIGYNAYAYDSSVADAHASKAKREYFIRMMVAVVGSMNIMMLSVAKYTGFFTGITEEVKNMIHIGEFLLSTPVLFYSGWVFYKGAYYGLKNKMITMDFLVATGSTATYIYSLFILFGAKGDSYFDSVAMIITFVLVGKYLEVIGKKSAIDTLDRIKSSLPLEATVISNEGKKVVALNSINIDDIVELKAGEKVPVDGILQSNDCSFDTSAITGEFKPKTIKENEEVLSGFINISTASYVKVTSLYKDSTIAKIIELIENASSKKANAEKFITKFASVYTPIVIALALILAFIPPLFIEGAIYSDWIERALVFLVISCPCALVVSIPLSFFSAIGAVSKKGVLVKGANYIEKLTEIQEIIFDKTGTLTKGVFQVTRVESFNLDKNELLKQLLFYRLLAYKF
jgi:Cu+-exporting ATPase